jgi:hypothetical protein
LGCSAYSPNSLHSSSTFSLSQVTFRWVLCHFLGFLSCWWALPGSC